MKNIILLFLFGLIFLNKHVNAQNNNEYLVRSTMGILGSSNNVIIYNSNIITIQQSIGQLSPIGTFSKDNYAIRQGFIQPNILVKIIDKNIPLSLDLVVSIYPNPFINDISVSLINNNKNDIYIEVYDVLGRLLYKKKYFWNKSIIVELGNYPTGTYLLKVINNNQQTVKKIIKK